MSDIVRASYDKAITPTGQRHETTGVERDVHVEHRTHAVDHGRVYYGDRGVEVSAHFTACAVEIEMG